MAASVIRSATLKSRPTLKAFAAIAAIAIVSAIAGCGNSSASNAGSGENLGTVTIAKAVQSVGFAAIDVAIAKGYFKDEGVSVKDPTLSGSSVVYAALQSGSIQFAAASAPAMLPALAKGVPLYSIVSLDYGNPLQLLVSKKWARAHNMTPQNQDASTVMQSLKGASLASISTSDTQAYSYLENLAKVPSSDFRVITVDSTNAALAGLQHGLVDAFMVPPPTSIEAQSQGIGIIMPSLKSIPAVAMSMFDVVSTTRAYAKSHKAVVTAIATALARAENEMAEHPTAVIPILEKQFPSMSENVLKQSLSYLSFAHNGLQSESRWTAANKLLGESGGKPTSLDFGATGPVWTNKYIDISKLQ